MKASASQQVKADMDQIKKINTYKMSFEVSPAHIDIVTADLTAEFDLHSS